MNRSRATAFIALLGMAWAALLPFTAAARMLATDAPTEYCHKLSIDSVLDPDPAAPDGPSQPRKGPCPFCSMYFSAAPTAPLPIPSFVAFDHGVAPAPVPAAPVVLRFTRELPPSHAPPAASPLSLT